MKARLKNWFFVNLANMVTTARLILSVWLISLIISSEHLLLMFILVVFCGISDILDGLVARWCRIESQFGSFLDRLADKIFVCPLVVILVWRYLPSSSIAAETKLFTVSLVAIVILLEILLIVSGIFSLAKRLDIASNKWGKAKMVFHSAAISLWVFSLFLEHYLAAKVLFFSIYLIDAILIAAIYLAVKSIEGYYQKWQQPVKKT